MSVIEQPARFRLVTTRSSGDAGAAPGVFCPWKKNRVELEGCLTCQHYVGFSVDPMSQNSFLHCGYGAESAATGDTAIDICGGSAQTPLREIMSWEVITMHVDTPLQDVVRRLVDEEISGAPVVDDAGKLVGMISKTDIAHAAVDPRVHDLLEAKTAADLMMPIIFCLTDDATVAQAAQIMVQEHVHRVPLISADGRVVGIVSSLDLLAWLV